MESLKFTYLAEPNDINFGGKVHGGEVMKWIDQAAYALAVKYSKGYAVTKFVDNIEFKSPINIGDLVTINVFLVKSGNTSMTFNVKVLSEHLVLQEENLNCECDIVFVAIDQNGKPRKIIK
jgi:acyl-CoA hydrolase|tara:strand:+ start:542 stop:904 length:363 start_codon:yes stop_codon:yes gene_type:complete